MNDLPPDDQFPMEYDPATNQVATHLVGEDAGDIFDLTERFYQKARMSAQVGFTVKAGVCEAAVGAREDIFVTEIIDAGIATAQELSSTGVSDEWIRIGQRKILEQDYAMAPEIAEAMISVIMRMAEV